MPRIGQSLAIISVTLDGNRPSLFIVGRFDESHPLYLLLRQSSFTRTFLGHFLGDVRNFTEAGRLLELFFFLYHPYQRLLA